MWTLPVRLRHSRALGFVFTSFGIDELRASPLHIEMYQSLNFIKMNKPKTLETFQRFLVSESLLEGGLMKKEHNTSEPRPFLVTADVYGLGLDIKSSFEAGGLKFKRCKIQKSMALRTKEEVVHVRTAEVNLIVFANDGNQALDLAFWGPLSKVSQLLTFALGRQVLFQNLRAVENEFQFEKQFPVRVGIPFLGTPRIQLESLSKFLQDVFMFFGDSTYWNLWGQTGLWDAIAWLNETTLSTINPPEIEFTMLWLGLESLTTQWRKGNPVGILPKSSLRKLRKLIRHWLRKNVQEKKTRETVSDRIHRLNEEKASDRIAAFLNAMKIEHSREEVLKVVRVRNDIQHLSSPSKISLRQGKRLLESWVVESIVRLLGVSAKPYLRLELRGSRT